MWVLSYFSPWEQPGDPYDILNAFQNGTTHRRMKKMHKGGIDGYNLGIMEGYDDDADGTESNGVDVSNQSEC